MSLPGAAPATRDAFAWTAQGTSTDQVADALRRLLVEAERTGPRHAASRTMNLVIAPGDAATIHAGLAAGRDVHPARVVHLVEHNVDRLDARVHVRLERTGDQHLPLLVEDVTIHANRDRYDHARSLLSPILARGVPTVAWLPGYDHGELGEALAATAHVTVFDSDADPNPGRALEFAYDTALEHPCRDLAWMRTARWRARISAAFQSEQRLGTLAFLPSAEIVGAVHSPATILLAAWIAAKADINVTLRAGADAASVEAVTVAGVAISPGAGLSCSLGLLGEALDTVYSPPQGYEDALRALDRVAIVA